jgi:hypothetical protein
MRLLLFGILLVTLVCLEVQATQSNKTIIQEDDLRKGFEVVYFITNTFIDHMTPKLPKVFYENITDDLSIIDLVNRTKEIDLLGDWKYYAHEVTLIILSFCREYKKLLISLDCANLSTHNWILAILNSIYSFNTIYWFYMLY